MNSDKVSSMVRHRDNVFTVNYNVSDFQFVTAVDLATAFKVQWEFSLHV
ncbi:hypothetical protein [Listeria ivanovii]|nr:hypothetical protein [Listeria ivanovii]